MKTTEAAFWRNELRAGLSALGHCVRIESGATMPGIPDINLKMPGHDEWWIELKVHHNDGKPIVRPAQWRWHKHRRDAGGRVMFLTKWHPDAAYAKQTEIEEFDSAVYLVNTNELSPDDSIHRWAATAIGQYHYAMDWRAFEGVLKNGR